MNTGEISVMCVKNSLCTAGRYTGGTEGPSLEFLGVRKRVGHRGCYPCGGASVQCAWGLGCGLEVLEAPEIRNVYAVRGMYGDVYRFGCYIRGRRGLYTMYTERRAKLSRERAHTARAGIERPYSAKDRIMHKPHEKICKNCERPFAPYRSDALFCCDKCRCSYHNKTHDIPERLRSIRRRRARRNPSAQAPEPGTNSPNLDT
jgi:hypothetical protein